VLTIEAELKIEKMKKISIENTYFTTWATIVGLAIGIALYNSSFSEKILNLYPYKSDFNWALIVFLPSLISLILCAYILLTIVVYFIKETLSNLTKFTISSTVAVPMLLLLSIGMNNRRCKLILDNGGITKANIEIIGLGSYIVSPHEFQEINISRSPVTIVADGIDTISFTPEASSYLYNYRQLNGYEIEKITYISNSGGKKIVFSEPIREIISSHSEKLFSFNVDFLFDAPKSISVSQGINEDSRTVLLRLSNK
jgi:hypothetical protein